ncbi:hypothetical protein LguiB_000033 [Lonicera macranthoides]
MEKSETVGIEYWLKWQVAVCALIFIIPSVVSLILITRSQRLINSTNLWLPCWTNLNPLWLLLYRAFALLSMAFLLYQTVLAFGFFVFYFYTQWTFALVMVYFALGTIVSARGCWMYSKTPFAQNGERDKFLKKYSEENTTSQSTTTFKGKETKSQGHNIHPQIDQRAGILEKLMLSVYHDSENHLGSCTRILLRLLVWSRRMANLTEVENIDVFGFAEVENIDVFTCAVMLTDIVFWCLLLPFMTGDNFRLTLLIGCMHSLNAVFLLLDSALNSLPFAWHRLTDFVLWSASYVVFQWVLHACCFTWWPYPFLDLSTPWAPMWYFSLALVHVPCYGLYAVLMKAKGSLFSKMFPHAFVRWC